jgi:hypothetical protein
LAYKIIQGNNMTQEHDQTSQKQQQQEHCHCHHDAAESHEQAAKHHKEAAKCLDAGDAQAAAHYAHIAHGHSIQAGEHEAECSKKYAKKHGTCENT